jgi:GTPase
MSDTPQLPDDEIPVQDDAEDWSEDHRSGVVTVVGRPNVGKSTLINAILGQKIAITSPKPQTTRRQQLGIYTTPDVQILFTDTPGIHKPHNKLGEYMYTMATMALEDADVLLWILDISEPPTNADRYIASIIQEKAPKTPVVLALNKIDLIEGSKPDVGAHQALTAFAVSINTSAEKGWQIPDLVEQIAALLPLGPRYYPIDQVSDTNMRFVAAEIVREKIILLTEQEIPYSVAVGIDGYKEGETLTRIDATIYVERDSQKGILIGKNGGMIKAIGTAARQELVAMLESPVHLELHVKVLKNWREDEALMKRLGYRMPKKEDE